MRWKRLVVALLIASVPLAVVGASAAVLVVPDANTAAGSDPIESCDDVVGLDLVLDAAKQVSHLDVREIDSACAGQDLELVVTDPASVVQADGAVAGINQTDELVQLQPGVVDRGDVDAVHILIQEDLP